MPATFTVEELESWNERILAAAKNFGLDPYPQEFEICDHEQMLAYMVYSGMPSHYPHWSYGKSFEKLKTLYDYGVSGLPYEMVINSNPAIAYLMRDNSLLLQVLTIAHVYGHNDFFKNNFTFKSTRAEFTIETFKTHADRVRTYVEDPSIGLERSSGFWTALTPSICNAGATWRFASRLKKRKSSGACRNRRPRSIRSNPFTGARNMSRRT
jgi:stage V sporulation protein R